MNAHHPKNGSNQTLVVGFLSLGWMMLPFDEQSNLGHTWGGHLKHMKMRKPA